jgi:peptide/nickel transport system permease protein
LLDSRCSTGGDARRSNQLRAEVAEQRELFGLDQPILEQYWTYLRETLSGNLGASYLTGQPVISEIASRLWPTILLVGVGYTLAERCRPRSIK